MPPFTSIKRRELIKALRRAGFEGPFAGGKHEFMVKGHLRLVMPNPHAGEISKELLIRILRQAKISREEWEKFS
jgi:predicted RNA binding protein YcfA (HicA-like mRNA interferase family)